MELGMSENNVVYLEVNNPRLNVFAPKTLEEIEESIECIRATHIQHVIDEIAPKLMHYVMIAGFDIFDDEKDEEFTTSKDQALIIESLRSMLLRKYDMPHPLQILASRSFSFDEDDDMVLDAQALLKAGISDDNNGPSTSDVSESDGADRQSYKCTDRRIDDTPHGVKYDSCNTNCQ